MNTALQIKLKPKAPICMCKRRHENAEVEVARIIKETCTHFNINPDDIFQVDRKSKIVKPRHVAMYLMLSRKVIPLSDVAYIFSKDHTTIYYAEHRGLSALFTKQDIYEDIVAINSKLGDYCTQKTPL